MNKFIRFIVDAAYRFKILDGRGFFRKWTDENYLKLAYRSKFHKKLNLENPQTYNEKLQWLKLYYRKPIMTKMVDKYEAKEYVADIIGEDYIIPTLGVWDRFEDIDFDALPNQFVIKSTHDSGGVYVCKDKANFAPMSISETINKSLKRNYYNQNREWPYKDVKPRIIAEQYMEDESGYELKDYKFFCFDGEVKALYIATDRGVEGEETKFDFFDADFNHLPFTNAHPNARREIMKPKGFEEMTALASKLSSGHPHVRVDFYDINGKIYFGELTFFHMSGMSPFKPEEWDYTFGSWIKLPNVKD